MLLFTTGSSWSLIDTLLIFSVIFPRFLWNFTYSYFLYYLFLVVMFAMISSLNHSLCNLSLSFSLYFCCFIRGWGWKTRTRWMKNGKSKWIKDGHMTPDHEWHTFDRVVSRESTRVSLTHDALKDFIVWACDIQNVSLQEPSAEKHYVVYSIEFGLENVVKFAIMSRALCCGKSARANYWRRARSAMEETGFSSYEANPDA